MTPTRTTATHKARGCTAGTVLATASGLYPASYHPAFAIPGLVSAAIFATVAASYRREAHEDATQARRSEA